VLNILLSLLWLKTQWEGYRKIKVNGTDDDDLLWNGSEDDGNVSSECEEDEGTDCEDGASDTDW
jgi:hypothetical protein